MRTTTKIIQSSRHIAPGRGVSQVAYNIEQELLKKGVFTERFTLVNLGKTHDFPTGKVIASRIKLMKDVVYYSIVGTNKLKKIANKEKDVIVITHNDALYGDIYVMHGLHKALVSRSNKFKMLLRNPLHIFLLLREEIRYKNNAKMHSVIVALTPEDKNEIIKFYNTSPDKIVVIPNGVNIEKFKPSLDNRKSVRKVLGIDEKEFVLSFVGHEFNRKGLKHILSAIHVLNNMGSKVHLIIAGGDTIDKFSTDLEGIENQVHYVGISNEVEKYYNASDLFVLPSSFEAMALVGLEAMASGCPALMTDVGGSAQYIKDGFNGYIIQQNGEDIANKINEVLSGRADIEKMSRNSRLTALDYSWDKVVDKYIDLATEVYTSSKLTSP